MNIPTNSLKEWLDKSKPLIDERLKELLDFPKNPAFDTLFHALGYAVEGGGKRLRPLLLLLTVHALGGDEQIAIDPACALELIHTYSLIHDDLPCMDDDDYRRGRLTVHKAYDEATAVLSGDALLTYAFEVLTNSPGITDSIKIQLVKSLALHAGKNGMILGQSLDGLSEGKVLTAETIQYINALKTCTLLMCACEMGCQICQKPVSTIHSFQLFAYHFGIAFQLMDDLLDIVDSYEHKGRISSSDIDNNKATLVSVLGVDAAKNAIVEHVGQAEKALQQTEGLSEGGQRMLSQLVHELIYRNEKAMVQSKL